VVAVALAAYADLAGAGVEEGVGTVPGGNGATCNSYHVRPRSRGEIRLRSSNPADQPLIDPNSFAEPYDLERHIDGIKITQAVGRSRAMKRFITAEPFPGPGVKTRDEYLACARANARSPYPPVGTPQFFRSKRTPITSKRFLTVPADSSAASTPFPGVTRKLATLLSSARSTFLSPFFSATAARVFYR